MTTIEIEDDIPIPDGPPRKTRYPWRDLAVGQSFFVPEAKQAPSVPPSVKEEGRRFLSQAAEKEGVPGYRVWRTQ